MNQEKVIILSKILKILGFHFIYIVDNNRMNIIIDLDE